MRGSVLAVFKAYARLTRAGIVAFVLLTAAGGYALSLDVLEDFSFPRFFLFCFALYLVSSGGFILNQVQEKETDKKMNRTKSRPVAAGFVTSVQACFLACGFILLGLILLFLLKPLTAAAAALTLVLYNGLYTPFWKRRMSRGAVLGAFPGAMPPVIGFSLGSDSLFSGPSVYLFLVLFLWQMPHFWSLAVRFKEDYIQGGIPVLPAAEGERAALFEAGLYLIACFGTALLSPLFLKPGPFYLLLPLLAVKTGYEFFKYFQNPLKHSKGFFRWINSGVLVVFAVPVLDKWLWDAFSV